MKKFFELELTPSAALHGVRRLAISIRAYLNHFFQTEAVNKRF